MGSLVRRIEGKLAGRKSPVSPSKAPSIPEMLLRGNGLLRSDPAMHNGEKVGRVLIYFGSSTGISDKADFELDGSYPNQEFGRCAAYVGDVNGDGYRT